MNSNDDGLLTAICQGLSFYQAYLATCNMHSVRSEYLFYEPIARIAQARGWIAKCEFEVPSISKNSNGDYRRVDFVFEKVGHPSLAVEVKYLKSKSISHKRTLENLGATEFNKSDRYIVVMGRLGHVKSFKPELKNSHFQKATRCVRNVGVNSGNIKYAATWFKLS